jgi:hypothetical protein
MSQRQELKDFSKVEAFLQAIGKNSRKTRSNYENALVHLERYVSKTYPELSTMWQVELKDMTTHPSPHNQAKLFYLALSEILTQRARKHHV